jgi:hypothetical protein
MAVQGAGLAVAGQSVHIRDEVDPLIGVAEVDRWFNRP